MVFELTPISGHPVAAVTAWPVAVLAVGHVVLLQLVLHLLLDLDDLPESESERMCDMRSTTVLKYPPEIKSPR